MFYQGNTTNDNQPNGCGCGNQCPQGVSTYQQCNQVVQTCNVQDVPHYTNFHTHVVNNCIKRHIAIPTYSTSAENVYVDEYVDGTPMYQQPIYNPIAGSQCNQMGCGCQTPAMNTCNMQMMQQPLQYQGNVGVESPMMKQPMQYQGNIGVESPMMQQPMMYPGMNMPYNY